MKKKIFAVIAIVLCLATVLCSCGSKNLTFTTGGTGGTYYGFGSVLAQYITNNTDLKVTAIAGNGSKANIELIQAGDAEIAFVQNDVASYAFNGTNIFEEKIDCFSAACALYTEPVQIITCNPDIKTVADLAGKSVSIGSAGSGVFFNAVDVLSVYGLDYEKDINAQYLSFSDSADSLKDGKIDAAFIVAGTPTSAVTELAATTGTYLVSLDDEHIAALQEKVPVYAKYVIESGTYSGVDEDITTVGIKATIIVDNKLDEKTVYTLVSTIFENKADITEAYAKGAELDLEYASSCGIPYHAGAVKYFAEKGFTAE
jgi:hypothetical protein